MMVTVIGRGHGGTRAIAQTLGKSGVYLGDHLNSSWDLVPADEFYEACRVVGHHVKHFGGLEWDFSALQSGPIDPAFTKLVESYLGSVLASASEWKGWKLPETVLAWPWILRMFPDAYFINWVRDPRDSLLKSHVTDDLSAFNIAYDPTDNILEKRAISWCYQVAIVRATPRPVHWIEARFENFVLDQEATLGRLESFLGFPLKRIPVRVRAVGRWKRSKDHQPFGFLDVERRALGYDDE